jgi:hypothetical protein
MIFFEHSERQRTKKKTCALFLLKKIKLLRKIFFKLVFHIFVSLNFFGEIDSLAKAKFITE